MSAGVGPDSAAMLMRAAEVRGRAAALCGEATVECRRTDEICERVVQTLLGASARPFGLRDAQFRLRVPRLRPLVRFTRQKLRDYLKGWDIPAEVAADVTLAFSEALANAVEHPRASKQQYVEVEALCEDGQIELRVHDFGSWSDLEPSEMRGRGLRLIRELVDSLDVRQDALGTELVMRRAI